ncbi:UbiA family prenyltransferase [Halorussus lipolyticus]|uniref:UbiA family prenyltransferase n=1 Tax=Halorussus lipolyticus TaxID=3034024 RepID=UPI0023E8A204|nr:UbiA family prenyltransferase [Halorussus sp. DT80]
MAVFDADSRSVRTTASAYAELVRVPNLFTAPPDVILGGALASAASAVIGTDTTVSLRALAGLAVGSILLYAGGTMLNDYFDAPQDADERPERPIPSGRVSRPAALRFGLGLLGAGVVVSGVAAGLGGALVASALAAAILLYDGALKGGPVGFLAMGSARGLNVLLGTTAAVGISLGSLPGWALAVPVVVAGYIAAVTYMAAEEATGAERRAVAVAGAGVVAATASALALVWSDGSGAPLAGSAFAVGFLAWTGRALVGAYRNPVPEVVGPAVGTCVVALVVLDAAFAAIAGVGWTLAVAAFLLPAVGLSRMFDVS